MKEVEIPIDMYWVQPLCNCGGKVVKGDSGYVLMTDPPKFNCYCEECKLTYTLTENELPRMRYKNKELQMEDKTNMIEIIVNDRSRKMINTNDIKSIEEDRFSDGNGNTGTKIFFKDGSELNTLKDYCKLKELVWPEFKDG